MKPSREECIRRAAAIFSEGYRVLYFAPLDEAARAAMSPGGPSFEELRAAIARRREQNLVLRSAGNELATDDAE